MWVSSISRWYNPEQVCLKETALISSLNDLPSDVDGLDLDLQLHSLY